MLDYVRQAKGLFACIKDIEVDTSSDNRVYHEVVKFAINYIDVNLVQDADDNDFSEIVKAFLKSVWYLYISSPRYREFACDIMPDLPLNGYLLQLAELTAEISGENKYQLLFPTLTVTEDYLLNKIDECWLHEFIICGDHYEGFFHIESSFSYLTDNNNDDYSLKLGFGNARDLSLEEQTLLRYKSGHACDVLTRREVCKMAVPFYYDELSRLREGLKKGDYRYGGDEHNAGSAANLAILNFKHYFDTLSSSQQSQILALSAERMINAEVTFYTFDSIWRYLTKPTYTQTGEQAVAYCIFYKGEDIDAILSTVKQQQVRLNDKLAQSILRLKDFTLAAKLVPFSDFDGVMDLQNLSAADYSSLIDVAIENKVYPMITCLHRKSECILSYKTILHAADVFDQANYHRFLNVITRYGEVKDSDGARVAFELFKYGYEEAFFDLIKAGDNQFPADQLGGILKLALQKSELNVALLKELFKHNQLKSKNGCYFDVMGRLIEENQDQLIRCLLETQHFPLWNAFYDGHIDILLYVIQQMEKDKAAMMLVSHFEQALKRRRDGVYLAQFLIDVYPDVITAKVLNERLYQAIRENNIIAIRFLLNHQVEIPVELIPKLVSFNLDAINSRIICDISSGKINLIELFFNENNSVVTSVGKLWSKLPVLQKKKLFDDLVVKPIEQVGDQLRYLMKAGLAYGSLPGSLDNSAQLKAFIGIYLALRDGQTSLLKTNFIRDAHGAKGLQPGRDDGLLLLNVIRHAYKNPKSRTAQAWMLTQKYYAENWQQSTDLFKEVHDYAYQHSAWWAKTTLFSQSVTNDTGALLEARRQKDANGVTRTSKILNAFAASAA